MKVGVEVVCVERHLAVSFIIELFFTEVVLLRVDIEIDAFPTGHAGNRWSVGSCLLYTSPSPRDS